ncbi:DUF4360 domain-containing protein [Leucothrix pacifica]|uniref:DUF4360 domain-containing protein n=1 Tax=Leucothrix pacifica TaxID=1247513 RepID=A0A317CQR3_9GAMM|nr:DUF4360 domain-containing protein [Leucothrix pacifica]PWR00620.1 hypothetical protein DKW60_00980 [Leucothrix pacifica]
MKRPMKPMIAVFVTLAFGLTPTSFANEPLELGEVKFAGNGCPISDDMEHTTIVRKSANSLSIIPTEMTLMTPDGERTTQRKKCDIALAVSVEDGYQLRIVNTKLQAFVSLDTNSAASISLDAGFSGGAFTKAGEKLPSDTTDNTELAIEKTPWSDCGKDVIVRAKASMILRSDQTQTAYMRVNGMSFKIESQACSTAD